MDSSGRLCRIVDTKIVFSGKMAVFMPFFYRLTRFCSVVEVSACFWTVSGQSGAELPIFNTYLTNHNKENRINVVFYSVDLRTCL